MPTSPDQLAVFDALLAQARPLLGQAADAFEGHMRQLWALKDPDAVLHALALRLRELRRERPECEDSDDAPGAS